MDPFSQASSNDLYNFDLKEKTFSDTENAQIKHFTKEAKEAVKGN